MMIYSYKYIVQFFIFISFVSQQYCITEFGDTATFPLTSFSEHKILAKKIKGVPSSNQKKITYLDFFDVAVNKKKTRTVLTASFKKKSFHIFLIRGKRRILSLWSDKRLYNNRFKRRNSFFSFPLYWKGRLIHWHCWRLLLLLLLLYLYSVLLIKRCLIYIRILVFNSYIVWSQFD